MYYIYAHQGSSTPSLAGILASTKHVFDTSGCKLKRFKQMFAFLDLGCFGKVVHNCGEMTPTPLRSILHAAKPSQMPYNAQNDLSQLFAHKNYAKEL